MIALLIALLAPSAVVIPPGAGFNHEAHAFPCVMCHPTAGQMQRSKERARPNTALCAGCHPEGSKAALVPSQGVPALHFNHLAHRKRGVKCEQCHPKGGVLPTEATCRGCHDGQQAPNRCSTCHPVGPDGRLRTEWPRGQLKPSLGTIAHDEHWVIHHSGAARAEPETCDACHTPKQCDACHQGPLRPLQIHPADYILSHPAEARRRAHTCESCHRPQTFCRDCHIRSGVVLNADPRAFGRATPGHTRFHTKAFRGTMGPPGPEHHKHAARRDLVSCTSCHEQADCVRCHSTATRMINPHPPGTTERLCDRARRVASGGCAQCHPDTRALEQQCDER